MGLWGVFAIGIMELEKVCSYVGIELWGRSYWVWSYGVIESVVMFYRVMGMELWEYMECSTRF